MEQHMASKRRQACKPSKAKPVDKRCPNPGPPYDHDERKKERLVFIPFYCYNFKCLVPIPKYLTIYCKLAAAISKL